MLHCRYKIAHHPRLTTLNINNTTNNSSLVRAITRNDYYHISYLPCHLHFGMSFTQANKQHNGSLSGHETKSAVRIPLVFYSTICYAIIWLLMQCIFERWWRKNNKARLVQRGRQYVGKIFAYFRLSLFHIGKQFGELQLAH